MKVEFLGIWGCLDTRHFSLDMARTKQTARRSSAPNSSSTPNQPQSNQLGENGWSMTQGGRPIEDMEVPDRISGQFVDLFQRSKGDHKEKFALFDRLRDEENW